MNFDDIKSAWNNDNEGSNIVVPSSVDQLKTLQLPVEKLRKAMQMEFFVKDKALLKGLAVGDKVDFVLEYKHPTEIIVGLKKAQ